MSPGPSPFKIAASLLDAEATQGQWESDPIAWVESQFGATPDPWQGEALQSLALGRHIAIRSGHGVGKTTFLAWVVLWWLDVKGYAKVPCAAPTEHQLEDHLWPEMNIWLTRSKMGLDERILWKARRVYYRGRERTSFAVMRAAGPDNKPENLAGFHSDNLLFVVDEASGVADRNMTVVTGALTTEGAQLVMTGNPTRPTGFFAKRFTEDNEKWHVATISSKESKRVSETWAQEVAADWGVDSDEYRVRVLGLPPRGDSRGFISPELVDSAQIADFSADGTLILGVDVARYGKDKSVIAARRGRHVYPLLSYAKLGNPELTQKVLDAVDQFTISSDESVRIIIDDDGVGGGVTDLLRMVAKDRPRGAVRISINGVTFGGAGNRWYTTNAGVWWARLRKLMQDGDIDIPKSPILYQQLTDRMSSVNMKGKTVLESKDHMQNRGVHSPDEADAIALTLADGGQGSGFLEYWKQSSGQSPSPTVQDFIAIDDVSPDDTESKKTVAIDCKKHFFGLALIGETTRKCVYCGISPEEMEG